MREDLLEIKQEQKENVELFEGLPDNILKMVVKPVHYFKNGFSPIELMDTVLAPELVLGYMLGNMIKYITRYKDKDKDIQDIAKVLFHNSYIINYIKETPENVLFDEDNLYGFKINLFRDDLTKEMVIDLFEEYSDVNSKNKGDKEEVELFLGVIDNIRDMIVEKNCFKLVKIAERNNVVIKELLLYLDKKNKKGDV